MNGKTLAVALTGTLLIAFAAGALAYSQLPNPAAHQGFRLEYSKTGGIAGVNDTLVIQDNGTATLVSKYGVSFSKTVGAVEFSELKHVIAGNLGSVSPRTLRATSGAADYFAYRLVVTDGSGTTEISWVDQWAVNGTFPEGLKLIQGEVQKLTVDLTDRQAFVNAASSQTGALRMTVLTDNSSYRIGDEVNFAVILENTGSSNINYTSPTPCSQDIRVVVSNGTASIDTIEAEGSACIQVLQGRVLQGDTYLVETGSWHVASDQTGNAKTPLPGTYTISAVFPYASFEKPLVSSSVNISVSA